MRAMKTIFSKDQKGLTIVEILLACFILAVISCIVIPKYQSLRKQAKAQSEEYLITTIKNGIELYKSSTLR